MAISIHPAVNRGAKKPAAKNFAGGTLTCKCAKDPVTVSIKLAMRPQSRVRLHQMLEAQGRACSRRSPSCRAKTSVKVTANAHKLQVVDPSATIQRHACKDCGVHMYGRIENKKHPFYGLDFIHTELSKEKGWSPPNFAAFVSSIIESGAKPAKMDAVRARLKELGLEPYDCLSPALMDAIATHVAKASGALK